MLGRGEGFAEATVERRVRVGHANVVGPHAEGQHPCDLRSACASEVAKHPCRHRLTREKSARQADSRWKNL